MLITNFQQLVKAVKSLVKSAPKYKVYRGFITQTGTGNPTLKTLENTIGTIDIVRYNTGLYGVLTDGLFVYDKTFFHIQGTRGKDIIDISKSTDNDEIVITSYGWTGTNFTAQDGRMSDTPIEIIVYP